MSTGSGLARRGVEDQKGPDVELRQIIAIRILAYFPAEEQSTEAGFTPVVEDLRARP